MSATQTQEEQDLLLQEVDMYNLILHNDDVHTFDFVIDQLVKICKHDVIQAEQCAYIVHFSGKCQIKRGDYQKLQGMSTALQNAGLSVTIE